MVTLTEASGIADLVYGAVEGILTGDSRLYLVGNPHYLRGGFYESFNDPMFSKFELNSMDALNVKEKNYYTRTSRLQLGNG